MSQVGDVCNRNWWNIQRGVHSALIVFYTLNKWWNWCMQRRGRFFTQLPEPPCSTFYHHIQETVDVHLDSWCRVWLQLSFTARCSLSDSVNHISSCPYGLRMGTFGRTLIRIPCTQCVMLRRHIKKARGQVFWQYFYAKSRASQENKGEKETP